MKHSRHNKREIKQANEFLEKLLHRYLDERPECMDSKDGVLFLNDKLSYIRENLNREWNHFVSKWNRSPKRSTELPLNKFMESVNRFDEKIRINIWMFYAQAKVESYYGLENYDKKELLRLYNNYKKDPETACSLFVAGSSYQKAIVKSKPMPPKKDNWFMVLWQKLTAKLNRK